MTCCFTTKNTHEKEVAEMHKSSMENGEEALTFGTSGERMVDGKYDDEDDEEEDEEDEEEGEEEDIGTKHPWCKEFITAHLRGGVEEKPVQDLVALFR